MASFFPTRHLSRAEWYLVPGLAYQLIRAWILVYGMPSRYWLPPTLLPAAPQHLSPAQIQEAQQMAVLLEGWTRRLPWRSTCLIKALAAWQMLKNRGIQARIQLGVKRNATEGLGAHAWLVLDNLVLVGGKEAKDFQEIEARKSKV